MGPSSRAMPNDACRRHSICPSRPRFSNMAHQPSRRSEDADKAVYGKELASDTILAGGIAMPAGAKPLTQILTKYSPKGV